MKSIAYDNKELYWKRIQLISFVLAVFIIIRHNSSLANYDAPIAQSIYDTFKYSITEVAVPLFFLISGFNYFNGFSISVQKRKLKSRIKSLLVPYLTWNTLYCIFCVVTSLFFSQFFIGRTPFTISPLNVIWGCVFHQNCNSHFWFVFDLMVCVVLNPIIYYVLRNKIAGISFLTVLFVAIFCFGLKLPINVFYRTDAFLYYYIGAFLGLHFNTFFYNDMLWKTNTNASDNQRINKANVLYFIIGVLCMCSSGLLLIPDLHGSVRCIIILVSAYGFWKVSAICRFVPFRWLPQGGTVFLFYAAHGIIQPMTVKLLYLILPKNNWMAGINFIFTITITMSLCILLRYITKRFLPPIDKVLTGWRR